MMNGFYRDVKKVEGTSIALLEAAVKIYDENYIEPRNKSKLRERVKLVEVRKSLGYDNQYAPFFRQRNLLEDLLQEHGFELLGGQIQCALLIGDLTTRSL